MISKLFSLAILYSLVLARPTAGDMIVHEARDTIPDGYVRTGAAPANTQLLLRIALVQNNPEGLVNALYDVSTPGSTLYGQHLSKEEVRLL